MRHDTSNSHQPVPGRVPMESVHVVVRCRPTNSREKTLKCQPIVKMDNANAQCILINPVDSDAAPKCFSFDGAYGDDSTTEQIYDEVVFPIVESVTEGYNGTVFAYGQTGCGKSFSMQGITNPPTQRGIIPRSFEHIFEAIVAASNTKYLVNASYLEIYNEEIRDLLSNDPKKKCDMKERPDTGVYIPGLSLHTVNSVAECELVMEQGWKNRSVGATLMNADSSRSHSIFTIHVEQMETSGGKHIKKGKLNLVDLAGSERQCKTGAIGDRLKEATKINLSLSALGNVISALVDGKSKHVPYRDSKLTRLLQDSLGGNTKTLMIACLSPADNNYEETLSTLRYANRAKNIKNRPKVNEDPKDAQLREYKEELERLKKLLVDQVASKTQPSLNPEVKIPKNKSEKFTSQMEDLKQQFEREKLAKDKLLQDMIHLKEFYERKLQEKDDSGNTSDSPEIKHVFQDAASVEKLEDEPALMEQMQSTALQRLQELQSKIVGGEKAHDVELKKQREKRKNHAEKRIRAMAEVLARIDATDDTNLPDYEDVNAQLETKTAALKKAKKKMQSLEVEIRDLQGEFERERTDYLDTIRRQEKQMKLHMKLLEKVQHCIRRDCNYANIKQVKAQAEWDEDTRNWRIPDVILEDTTLPLAEISNNTRNDGGSPKGKSNGTVVNGWFEGLSNGLSDKQDDCNNNDNDRVNRNNFSNKELCNKGPGAATKPGQGLFGAAVVAARSRSLPSKQLASGTVSPEGGFFIKKPTRLESLGVNGEQLPEPPAKPRGRRRSRTYEDLLDAWPAV